MKEIKLTFVQANSISNDFQFLIGKYYNVNGAKLKVESVDIEELDGIDGYTVVVRFEGEDIIKFYSIIDQFCFDAKIDFRIEDYIG